MVYHSVPDPNKTYPHQMENFELTKFEITKVYYTPEGLINCAELTVTTFFPREMDLTRDQIISFMRQQGCNFYFKGKILHIDWINNIPYVHLEKSTETRDILE